MAFYQLMIVADHSAVDLLGKNYRPFLLQMAV